MAKVPYVVETISPDDPVFTAVDALIDAGVPESQIDWDRVGEIRRLLNAPIDDTEAKYIGSTPNGTQFKA